MSFIKLFRPIQQCRQRSINVLKISTANFHNQHPIKFLESQDRWRERDNVSKRYQLIYKAPMEKYLKYLSTYLTFTTTTLALGGAYYAAFVFDMADINRPVVLGEDVVIANGPVECMIYIGAFVAFHTGLKIVLNKYAVRLYQDGDNFIAVFMGNTFGSVSKHEFRLQEFKKLNSLLALSWTDARFALGDKKVIILEKYFKTPEHFNYLLNKKGSLPVDDEDIQN